MGYEVKLFVVRLLSLDADKIVLNGQDVYDVFQTDSEEGGFYYYRDGCTKVRVTNEPMITAKPALIVSMFELGKIGETDSLGICKFEEADGKTCSVYTPSDGNKLLGIDPYGDYRKVVPLDKVIAMLEKMVDKYSYVVESALVSLKVLQSNDIKQSLACIFYGH